MHLLEIDPSKIPVWLIIVLLILFIILLVIALRTGREMNFFGIKIGVRPEKKKQDDIFENQILNQQPVVKTNLSGNWTGIFKEYRDETRKEDISAENVLIKEIGEKQITGTLSANTGYSRVREFEGKSDLGFLIISYFGDAERIGAASYVLKGKAENGEFIGYWLGYDPEIKKLLAAPYVLTKSIEISKTKEKHQAWLNQSPYHIIDTNPNNSKESIE